MTDARAPGTKEPRHHSWLGNLDIDTLLLGSGRAFCLVDVICTVPIGIESRKRSMPALLNTSGVACLSGDRTRKCLNLGSFLQFRKSLNWLKKTNWKQRLALQRHSGWGKVFYNLFCFYSAWFRTMGFLCRSWEYAFILQWNLIFPSLKSLYSHSESLFWKYMLQSSV